MPLKLGYFRNLEEEPLSGLILKGRFDDPEFHGAAGVNENLGKFGFFPRADFPPHALSNVEDTRPDDESPALVSKAMLRGIERERAGIIWVDTITNETTRCVGVKSNHEKESQVVGVPESLEALVADLMVSSGVHEEHGKKHEVTCDSTRLTVVDV
jgi:hypothetical protein